MAVDRPFCITYGTRSVGGSSSNYFLHLPYTIDKSYEQFRLNFEVVVVATSYATLYTLCDNLETDFRKRDLDLTIDLDNVDDPGGSSTFTFTAGTHLLNVKAGITKTGNEESDRGYSRSYACTVEGDLPASDNDGLRDVEVNVDYEAGRQKIVTMRGVYTADSGTAAAAQYISDFGRGSSGESNTFLTAIDNSVTWELVDESYTIDRNDHLCPFTQQYLELLEDQSSGTRDDGQIRDHRLTFSNMGQFPGDSGQDVYRLQRTKVDYDCAIDVDQTTDLQTVYATKIRPHALQRFRELFSPSVMAVEEARVSYDETTKRISVSFQVVHQSAGGESIVEYAESITYNEIRSPDITYVHGQGEFSAYVDQGWANRERIWDHSYTVIGAFGANSRIGSHGSSGTIIRFNGGGYSYGSPLSGRAGNVKRSGWNVVRNTSRATPLWIGDPDEEQIRLTQISEQVVEMYTEAPR